MDKTTKLYYDNSHETRFSASVLSCDKIAGGWSIVLDRTLFYPEGGGQPADAGILGGVHVSHVMEQDGVIFHHTDAPLTPGRNVSGEVDWERRFAFMQNHTGEHIVSGILDSRFGLSNVGFHMGSDFTTIDTSGPISAEDIRTAELLANKAVYANIKVSSGFPDGDSLRRTSFRSKLPESALIGGEIRIVNIPGCDSCACCGIHCDNTGQVGIIKLVDSQKYKAGTRIYMLCGERALLDYVSKNDDVYRISRLLSAKPGQVSSAVRNLLEDNAALEQKMSVYKNRIFAMAADSLPMGTVVVYRFEEGLTPDDLKRFAVLLADRAGTAAVFSGQDRAYKYAVGGKSGVKDFTSKMNENLNGRGGGQDNLVQGSVSSSMEEIQAYFDKLNSRS